MNTLDTLPSSPRRQLGAASVGIAILIMFILTAAVVAVLKMSGASVFGAAKNEQQVAALFVAESGVQRALGVITKVSSASLMKNSDCTALTASPNSYAVGTRGGAFSYSDAIAKAATGETNCGNTGEPTCATCAVTVTGTLPEGVSRKVRLTISTSPTEGAAGCGSTVSMAMPVQTANSYAFTHLAYRPQNNGTGCSGGIDPSAATIRSCENTGGTCSLTTAPGDPPADFWDNPSSGNNSTASFGVSAKSPATGSYQITTKLEVLPNGQTRGTGTPVLRNYVQTGLLFTPIAGSLAFEGSYSSNSTKSSTGLTGSMHADWTCQRNSYTASPNMPQAARSDTLTYGFAHSPEGVNAANLILSNVILGIQPMQRLTQKQGKTPDHLYSQIWFTFNTGYDSTSGSGVPTASNGATFSGSVGTVFTGGIDDGTSGPNPRPAGTKLKVTSVSQGVISIGDVIATGASAGTKITAQDTPTGSESIGGKGTYTVDTSQQVGSGTTMTINGSTLTITNLVGALTVLDTITNFPGGALVVPFNASANGSYSLGASYPAFLTTNNLTSFSPAVASSVGTASIINLTGTPSAAPKAGTAVAVWSASSSGQFTSTVFTGSITGGDLSATLGAGESLCYGDALFGEGYHEPYPSTVKIGIQPYTTIARPGCSATGPWTVSGTTEAPTGTMVARAAVIPKKYSGTISGTTLTVNSIESGSVAIGDVLWVGNVSKGTISGRITGSGGGGGTTYTVTNPVDTSGSFVATNINSFAVSRQPATSLRSAYVCGGVCALLFNAAGTIPNSGINLALSLPGGATNNFDWSSGFACLSGVDPNNIVTLGQQVAKRGFWAEVIQ